jgi:GT2 family glycosyltransferase
MTQSLDIVIVNWNTGPQLRCCLESVAAARRDAFELRQVIVVDNASEDGSAHGLEEIDLPLTILSNTENRGFAVACNQGARIGNSDYILFLNPDTVLFADSLPKPLQFMADPANSGVGICGIKLLDEQGSMNVSCARFPNFRIFLGAVTGLSHFFPKQFPNHFMSPLDLHEVREVDQVIGAFFLVRRTVYNLLGGFSEAFFVYYEEVDFSLEAKKKGFSSYFLSNATAYHRGGGSSDVVKSRRLFYSLRSRHIYWQKHFTPCNSIAMTALTLLLELPARLARSIFHGSPSEGSATLQAYAAFLHYLLGSNR